uniref:Variant surface glycoprotein 1125.5742 n=1 Tax=Trypanosoma brucei TaxID=5691 RepID=A0A1J0RDB0_9TRYP|nr:variant surface glycoprotein 1125.5742 [Trypanosoma brucei]
MITAAATTGELRGTIAETFSALKLNNGAGSTTYCLANEQGNAAEHANPILDKFKYTTEAVTSDKTKLDSAIVGATGFGKLAQTTYTLTSNGGGNVCGMFTTGAAGAAAIGNGQTPLMTAGLWKVTADDTIQVQAFNNLQHNAGRPSESLPKAAHYDAVWVDNLEEVTVYTSDEDRIKEQSTTTAASNILAANMKHDATKDEAGKIDKAASEAISNLFTKPANAAKQLIATINGKEVEDPRQDKGKKVKLSNVQDA